MNNTLQSFTETLQSDAPPETLSVYLKALWYERKRQWSKAHGLNASYWYYQAGTEQPDLNTDMEWDILVNDFMVKPTA